jgi:hypothetical protein
MGKPRRSPAGMTKRSWQAERAASATARAGLLCALALLLASTTAAALGQQQGSKLKGRAMLQDGGAPGL